MQKRLLSALLMVGLLFPATASFADEGMWLLMLLKKLNSAEMKKKGLKLKPEELYSINNSSLKDAIGGLNSGNPQRNFCTSEMISSNGLLLTNHHCAYDLIQNHSSEENDYLTEGFWAMSYEEELPNPGTHVSFLVRMEDVTKQILDAAGDKMGEERDGAVQEKMAELSKEAKGDTHYDVFVKSFFEDNEYYLFVMETFHDVRLVGAPPSSIGKFGGDTDNWMWPRQTGDFSLLRVYTDKDGKPAEYSKDNIPMKARHHLPVSIAGVKPGDFTMVMGFPGSTDRYRTSFGLKQDYDINNPARIKLREQRLAIMKEDMNASDRVRIQYASKYASTSNYYKYFIGQNRGLRRLGTIDFKEKQEAGYQKWADANGSEGEKKALENIKKGYEITTKYALSQTYLNEAVFAPEIIGMAYGMLNTFGELMGMKDQEKAKELIEETKEGLEETYGEYNVATDKKIFAAMMKRYYYDVPKDQQPAELDAMVTEFEGDFDAMTEDVYRRTMFSSKEKVHAFLDAPSQEVMNDPVVKITMAFLNAYRSQILTGMAEGQELIDKGRHHLVAGLRKWKKNKNFSPDANSTIRLTYGEVGAYEPMDGVDYDYYTTANGIVEKEDPNDDEFIVPEKLMNLIAKKDYGRYADKSGEMRVCFISDNDITGGNSGSPVINGKGQLVGLAFDGNWESMTGDLVFEDKLQRCISVDIRYVLFIIDKYAGAKRLIEEMDIVTK